MMNNGIERGTRKSFLLICGFSLITGSFRMITFSFLWFLEFLWSSLVYSVLWLNWALVEFFGYLCFDLFFWMSFAFHSEGCYWNGFNPLKFWVRCTPYSWFRWNKLRQIIKATRKQWIITWCSCIFKPVMNLKIAFIIEWSIADTFRSNESDFFQTVVSIQKQVSRK